MNKYKSYEYLTRTKLEDRINDVLSGDDTSYVQSTLHDLEADRIRYIKDIAQNWGKYKYSATRPLPIGGMGEDI